MKGLVARNVAQERGDEQKNDLKGKRSIAQGNDKKKKNQLGGSPRDWESVKGKDKLVWGGGKSVRRGNR